MLLRRGKLNNNEHYKQFSHDKFKDGKSDPSIKSATSTQDKSNDEVIITTNFKNRI